MEHEDVGGSHLGMEEGFWRENFMKTTSLRFIHKVVEQQRKKKKLTGDIDTLDGSKLLSSGSSIELLLSSAKRVSFANHDINSQVF